MSNHEAELEALKLRNAALQESIDGCAKKVLSLVQTRKELITLLEKVVNQAHLSHTERCTWEELNHGGDCNCAVGARHYVSPSWPGLKVAIERTLEREKS